MSMTPQKSEQIRCVLHECIVRREAGEAVSDQELAEAHSDLEPELSESLKGLHLIESALSEADQLVPRQVAFHLRCPHCHCPMESVEESQSSLVCDSCGGAFGLTDEPAMFREGSRIAHFELIEKLGCGAFGTVWSAQDTELDRLVAVKIPRKVELTPAEVDRFIREARTVARLTHPNIVRVHEVGRHDHTVYLVTDLLEGQDLAEWLAENQPIPQEAAYLCATLADALEHAHQQDVIHRDLKPSNVMMSPRACTGDQRQLNADDIGSETCGQLTLPQPIVMDFGLAKREATEITLTADGKLVGTPAYMSPEQARGMPEQADERSDIYSLGVILFEMLTGERPFRGSARMLLHQVLMEDAPSPRLLNGSVPKDLDTICLKCLEKRAEARYQSAADLANDLRRFLAGQPVVARPISFAAHKWRWCRRNPVTASLGAALAVILVGALASVTALWLRSANAAALANALATSETAARHTAESERKRAEEESGLRRRAQYFSDIVAAHQAWEDNDFERCVTLLRRHVSEPHEQDLRNFGWYYLWKRCQPGLVAPTFQLDSLCSSVAFAPDGTLAAGGMKKLEVRHPANGPGMIFEPAHAGPITDLAFRPPDFRSLVSCSYDGALKLWAIDPTAEATVLSEQPRFTTHHPFTSASFTPNGETLATNDPENGGFLLWDVDKKSSVAFGVKDPNGDPVRVRSVAYSPDGLFVALTCHDGTVRLWDVADGAQHDLWQHRPGKKADAIAFSPDGSMLASSGRDRLIKLGDVGKQVKVTLEGHTGYIFSLAFSPDGKTLASGSLDNTVRLWSVETGSLVRTLKGHSQMVAHVAFSPDGGTLASAAWDGKVKLWDLSPPPPDKLDGGLVMYSSDGETLVTSNWGSLQFWDSRSGKPVSGLLARLLDREHSIAERADLGGYEFEEVCAVTPDQRCLAVARIDGSIDLWDLSMATKSTLPGHASNADYLKFSMDGSVLASASGNELKLWNLASSKVCGDFDVFTGAHTPTASYAFSLAPDGKLIAFSKDVREGDFQFEIWDVDRRETLYKHQFSTPVVSTVFSADGSMLAAGCVDGTVTVWNVASGEVILNRRARRAISLAFSPDGTRLATGADQTIQIWTIPDGAPAITFREHTGRVFSLDFSPDGKTLASSCEDGTVLLYRATTDDKVRGTEWP